MLPFTEAVGAKIKYCGKMPILTDKFWQLLLMHIEHYPNSKSVVLGKRVVFQILQQTAHPMGLLYRPMVPCQAIRPIRL